MDAIIVTVTDPAGSFRCDLEMPVNQPVMALKPKIAQALNAYDPRICLREQEMQLVNTRTGRPLADHATLEMAGAWNGDYILIE